MLRINYKITIGSTVFSTDKQFRLIDLKMEAGLEVPVNICRVVLAPPKDLQPAIKDKFKAEIGYANDLTLVFTGTVTNVEWAIDSVTVYAASAFQTLVVARYNLYFDKPKAGDIVSNVAKQLKINTAKVDGGSKFSSYALGENQTAYQHLKNLAGQCGFDLYADADDKLTFAKYNAAKTHQFKFGKEILSFSLDEQVLAVTSVEVHGESPASGGQGEKAASWFTKKEVKGTAGDKKGLTIHVVAPTARTQELAKQTATGLLTKFSDKQNGFLKVLGFPQVKLGDAVQISDMPSSKQNATLKVTAITHHLNVRRGFVTTIGVQKG
jgi:hypothetical protein